MLNASWATLLRQIPADQHDQLVLITANGTNITIQSLLRIDFEFVIFKGRLSGSQDQGRLFIVPYGNIDYFAINRSVKDEEYTAMFAGVNIPDPDAPPAKPAVVESPPPPVKPTRQGAPVKSSVLERFRTRNTPAAGTASD
jgi:hypothetical protein